MEFSVIQKEKWFVRYLGEGLILFGVKDYRNKPCYIWDLDEKKIIEAGKFTAYDQLISLKMYEEGKLGCYDSLGYFESLVFWKKKARELKQQSLTD